MVMTRGSWGGRAAFLSSFALVALFGQSCHDDEPEIGGPGDPPAAHPFGTSNCSSCINILCEAQVQSCVAEPECGAYLQCLLECPTAASGDVDELCEKECARGTGSEYRERYEALTECRTQGAGSGCSSCRDPAWILSQECEPSQEVNPCWACEDESCCETFGEAQANPEAVAFKQCLVDCFGTGATGCEASCADLHPHGLASFARRLACVEIFCWVECGEVTLDSCSACLREQCAHEMVALSADAIGYLLSGCIAECSDVSCADACRAAYPSAVPLLDDFADCTLDRCGDSCD